MSKNEFLFENSKVKTSIYKIKMQSDKQVTRLMANVLYSFPFYQLAAIIHNNMARNSDVMEGGKKIILHIIRVENG